MDFSILDDNDEGTEVQKSDSSSAEIEAQKTDSSSAVEAMDSQDNVHEDQVVPEGTPTDMEASEPSSDSQGAACQPSTNGAEGNPSTDAGKDGGPFEGMPPCVILHYLKSFEQVMDIEIDKDLLFQKFMEKSTAMKGTIRFLLFAEY